MAAASAKISIGGAAGAVGGWALDSGTAATLGVVIAGIGTLASLFYNWRRDRREQREHEARMREMGQ